MEGVLAGRISQVDLRFRPRESQDWSDYAPVSVKTDGQGRFRIEALPPGYEFLLKEYDAGQLQFGGLRSGDTKDLGDVRTNLNRGRQGE